LNFKYERASQSFLSANLFNYQQQICRDRKFLFRNFIYYLNDYEELVAAKKFIQFLIRVITLRALTRTSLAEPFFLNHLK